MASTSPLVQQWLQNVLKPYPARDRVFADVTQSLAAWPSLAVKTDAFTFDSGQTALLLLLHGTVPITFRGATYHIPMHIWFPLEYPKKPPMVYVVPTKEMGVRKSREVEPGGRVMNHELEGWERKWEAHTLAALLQSLIAVFSAAPPVYAKPPPGLGSPPIQRVVASPPPQSPSSPLQSYLQRPPPPPSRPQVYMSPSGYGSSQRPEVRLGRSLAQDAHTTQHLPTYSPSSPISRRPQQGPPPPVPPHPQDPRLPPRPLSQGVDPHLAPPGSMGFASPPPHQCQTQGNELPSTNGMQHSQHQQHQHPAWYQQPSQQQQQQQRTPLSMYTNNARAGPSYSPQPQQQIYQASERVSSGPQVSSGSSTVLTRTALPVQQHRRAPVPDLLSSDNDFHEPLQASTSLGPAPPPPSKPPPPEIMHLHSMLLPRLQGAVPSLLGSLQVSQQQLRDVNEDLRSGEPAVRDEMARLEAVRAVCDTVGQKWGTAVAACEERVVDLESRGEIGVDEVVCSISIVHNQLIDLVADDNAIEDAIFHLARALDAERIDLERFLKATRSLAREQFQKRALIDRILVAMGERTT